MQQYLRRRRLLVRPCYRLHAFGARRSVFGRPKSEIEARQASSKRLHSVAHCYRGISHARLHEKEALSVAVFVAAAARRVVAVESNAPRYTVYSIVWAECGRDARGTGTRARDAVT